MTVGKSFWTWFSASAIAFAAFALLLAPQAVFCEEPQVWSGEIHFGTHVRQLADAGSFRDQAACNEWVEEQAKTTGVQILSAKVNGDAVTYRGTTALETKQRENGDDWRAFCRRIR